MYFTHGAVGPHPVGVAAAQAGVWYEGAVAVALVRALGSGELTVEPTPAGLAVALAVHTDAVVGTQRVQAVHCTEREAQRCQENVTKFTESDMKL